MATTQTRFTVEKRLWSYCIYDNLEDIEFRLVKDSQQEIAKRVEEMNTKPNAHYCYCCTKEVDGTFSHMGLKLCQECYLQIGTGGKGG